MSDELAPRLPLTYLSFVGEEGNRGVLVLDGTMDPATAIKTAWRLGLNPGGEVMCINIPDDLGQREYSALLENRNRLLRPDEARELLEAKPIREWEAEGLL